MVQARQKINNNLLLPFIGVISYPLDEFKFHDKLEVDMVVISEVNRQIIGRLYGPLCDALGITLKEQMFVRTRPYLSMKLNYV